MHDPAMQAEHHDFRHVVLSVLTGFSGVFGEN
jgi:hypothetical protein